MKNKNELSNGGVIAGLSLALFMAYTLIPRGTLLSDGEIRMAFLLFAIGLGIALYVEIKDQKAAEEKRLEEKRKEDEAFKARMDKIMSEVNANKKVSKRPTDLEDRTD